MEKYSFILLLHLLVAFQIVFSNPILPEMHADPEVLCDENKYYIYSTTDGVAGWGGYYFTCYSSEDLKTWKYEGIILDLLKDTKWAKGNAWAPAIEKKNGKYYFYYSGDDGTQKSIGVAVSESPSGPFVDFGQPIINKRPSGVSGGQQIDVDVFTDSDNQSYIYWGNGYMAGAKLNEDMVSIDQSSIVVLTPKGGSLDDYAYREGTYVFKRNNIYYFLWSVDDTGSANYHVAYGTSNSPLGPIKVADDPVILIQRSDDKIYGPGHNSILKIPHKDEWYIVYHRINPAYIKFNPGFHREVCIDKLEFYEDGRIKPVTPTN